MHTLVRVSWIRRASVQLYCRHYAIKQSNGASPGFTETSVTDIVNQNPFVVAMPRNVNSPKPSHYKLCMDAQ